MFLNFLSNNVVRVEALVNPQAIRSVEIKKTERLKLGSVCGYEKEYPVSVQYLQDTETQKLILVSTSNYGSRYKSLIGRSFDSLEAMKNSCLRIYTPPYLD